MVMEVKIDIGSGIALSVNVHRLVLMLPDAELDELTKSIKHELKDRAKKERAYSNNR